MIIYIEEMMRLMAYDIIVEIYSRASAWHFWPAGWPPLFSTAMQCNSFPGWDFSLPHAFSTLIGSISQDAMRHTFRMAFSRHTLAFMLSTPTGR